MLITSKFYETSEFILELAKTQNHYEKKRSNEEKLTILKLILSNQTLKANVDEFKNVTFAYDLKAPFKELAFLNGAPKWAIIELLLLDFRPLN